MSDNVLSYEGYLGSIETSLDDDCLYGKVLYVNDLITYEGKTVAEIKEAFVRAVKNYLDVCKRQERAPDKAFSGTFNVRVGPDLHREAAIYACREGIKLNELITVALKEKIEETKARKVEIHQHNHTYMRAAREFSYETESSYEMSGKRMEPWQSRPEKVKH